MVTNWGKMLAAMQNSWSSGSWGLPVLPVKVKESGMTNAMMSVLVAVGAASAGSYMLMSRVRGRGAGARGIRPHTGSLVTAGAEAVKMGGWES